MTPAEWAAGCAFLLEWAAVCAFLLVLLIPSLRGPLSRLADTIHARRVAFRHDNDEENDHD
jgi:hypothetical protein